MANKTIFDTVKEILEEQLGCNPDSITLDSNIVDEFGADSLDMIEILMFIPKFR